MRIERICVVGAGTMGHGIAQVAAMHGYDVTMIDIKQEILDRAFEGIRFSLNKFAEKGKFDPNKIDEVLSRIDASTELEAAKDASLIIESIPEDMKLKQETFKKLDGICPPETIFASNTSALSITEMASVTERKDKFIGMHWFNPPPIMRLIEIVKTIDTSEDTLNTIVELSKEFGKEVVICNDSVGFITSRALQALVTECIRILEEGVATAEDIDKAIKLGLNHPMGPFELLDFTNGIPVIFHAGEEMRKVYGERFTVPQTVRMLYYAGRHGRKSGKGFYDYTKGK
jgi:3-hydroxybutyryl-CoA dehydrogenase